MRVRQCYIDGCSEPATLILHTHPDDTLLCKGHEHLHEREEWDPPDEPCTGDGCEVCIDRFGLEVNGTCVEPAHWVNGRVGDVSQGHGHLPIGLGAASVPCREAQGEIPALYAFTSPRWPGLAKLMEEAGEVVQVGGKILMVGGSTAHWEGDGLDARLTKELADLAAAIDFMVAHAPEIDAQAFHDRAFAKLALFEKWMTEGDRPPA